MGKFIFEGMTALEIGRKINKREISSVEVTRAYLDRIAEVGQETNAIITVLEEEGIAAAKNVQTEMDASRLTGPLAGVPVIVKDNMCTKGIRTTAASKMLDHFIPPYNAGAVERLTENGGVMIGKANMDEFAMGGSTETSYYGPTKNPWNLEYVPGGSSGGSAAAVAADLVPYALGSDTGGSIRQPCSFCNLTGVKPTYGSVSRYGLMAYASSLDQIGPMAKTAEDCAAVLEMISGKDHRDSTSIIGDPFDFSGNFANNLQDLDLKGLKIGLPENYFEKGLDPEVKEKILEAAREMEKLGATVVPFSMPEIQYAVPAYYIIACAEASSNLSRYDGIKYGHRTSQADDILSTYYKSRSEGFGTEVKRRIMLGSFVLSSGYFDAYYKKGLQVRGLIKKAFDDAFSSYDMILSPTSPTTAYKIGGQIDDPLAMYMADIYTVSVNLAGIPAIALPCGFSKEGLPIGMQLIGDAFQEKTLLKAAHVYQQATDHHKQNPGQKEGGER